jgi:serine phosphatase RsbU (regulator of sigma subunit)
LSQKIEKLRYSLLILLLYLHSPLYAQNKAVSDSLRRILASPIHDTLKINTLNELSLQYRSSLPDSAIQIVQRALALAKQKKYLKGEGVAFLRLGAAYYYKSDYANALTNYEKSLTIFKQINDNPNIASAINNIGAVYSVQGNYAKAMEYYLQALKIAEKVQDLKGMGYANGTIGSIYRIQGNQKMALYYFEKSNEFYTQANDKAGVAFSLQSISYLYELEKEYDKAINYQLKAIKIREEIGDKNGVAAGSNRLAKNYKEKGDLSKALIYIEQALMLYTEAQSKNGISASLDNLSEIYLTQKEYDLAISSALKCLKISESINYKEVMKNACLTLSKAFGAKNNFQQAHAYHLRFTNINDSILSEENNKRVANLQAALEDHRKQTEIDMLRKNQEIQELTIKRNYIIGIAASALALLSLSFVVLLLRNIKEKEKTNALLEKQKQEIELKNKELLLRNEEITTQRDILDEKNTEIQAKNEAITESINYAKRIQSALLPPQEKIDAILPDNFILYKPRDIVSGDFYWFSQLHSYFAFKKVEFVVIVAIDCTGHGVPGALMTMIADSLLKDIIDDKKILEADLILAEMHKGLVLALKEEETFTDGMDVALCLINKSQQTLTFAGAKSTLYYFQNGQFFFIKGDKVGIGGEHSNTDFAFNKHEISLAQPTTFYIFSDGYQDQFGGKEGKKFMVKRFRDLLISIHHQPMKEQKQILEDNLSAWMDEAGQRQTDDVMVLGVRI